MIIGGRMVMGTMRPLARTRLSASSHCCSPELSLYGNVSARDAVSAALGRERRKRFRELLRPEWLLERRPVAQMFGNSPRAHTRREDERHPATRQHIGERIDILASQVNVENG